jgi:hypothetical protein
MVMVSVFARCYILLRFLVEGLLASDGTKIVRLPFVFGATGRGLGVNIHAANRIFCVHILFLS